MTKRDQNQLSWRDQEDLELYAAQLRDLSAHGQSYEPMGSGDSEVPSFPGSMRSFSAGSESALSRSIYLRLRRASDIYGPTETILLALHDPAAVMCDGKSSLTEEENERAKADPSFRTREKLDVGRRLAVYPCTWTADEARRWHHAKQGRTLGDSLARALKAFLSGIRKGGRQEIQPLERIAEHVALDGSRPVEILARMVADKRKARGAEAKAWAGMDDEAAVLIAASVRAWNEAGDWDAVVVDAENPPRPHREPSGRRARMMLTDVLTGAA